MSKKVTKRIGLSLGADLCWPACYEEIVKRLDLNLSLGSQTIDFAVERVTVEPFSLRQPCKYSVVLDRLTHWFHMSREWIKKSIIMDDLYVLNNPWALQSMEKHTSYAAMMHLGLPVPETFMVPPHKYQDYQDLEPTLRRYARHWDLSEVGEKLDYPLFMKPYDGGGWVGVTRIKSEQQLRHVHAQSGERVMHLQQAIEPFDLFVRAIGVGPQVNPVKYDPSAPLHDRYKIDYFFLDDDEWLHLHDMLLTINTYFGWDFNSCETLRKDGVFHPIDFANACPDSQVTSLHYHFPWLVKALIRWSLFCAATDRPMQKTLDWTPYEEVRKKGLPLKESVAEYGKIARERLQTEEFVEFCQTHLSHLDEVTYEFFGTNMAKEIVRSKVASLYPRHEINMFTEHFWGLIQFWRKTEADRLEQVDTSIPEGVRV
ncbi:MAG: hypothetical protein CL920_04695 [Deltaproteobacteria bacterium]|nr:hypothetical protein [Deltaproteobacteria bacterium]MBU47977.1 hypothetical protein [Deltaproteobacteria bacterium]